MSRILVNFEKIPTFAERVFCPSQFRTSPIGYPFSAPLSRFSFFTENDTSTDSATLGSGAAKSNSGNTIPTDHQLNPNSQGPPIVPDQRDEPTVPQSNAPARLSSRTPFTNLSQIDADLALARTLQEQERAYMMLRMNGDGGDYGSWEAGRYSDDDEEEDLGNTHDLTDADEEDAFDGHAREDGEDNNPGIEFDPNDFPSDEAYARALQDAEDREMAARLLARAGLNDREVDETKEENGGNSNSQDRWEEVDPGELSYEELLALGEVVGSESRGLSAETINSLLTAMYNSGSNDLCVICWLDYEDGDALTVLSCKHSYHSECIMNLLKINKVCPVCSAEVSTTGNG